MAVLKFSNPGLSLIVSLCTAAISEHFKAWHASDGLKPRDISSLYRGPRMTDVRRNQKLLATLRFWVLVSQFRRRDNGAVGHCQKKKKTGPLTCSASHSADFKPPVVCVCVCLSPGQGTTSVLVCASKRSRGAATWTHFVHEGFHFPLRMRSSVECCPPSVRYVYPS